MGAKDFFNKLIGIDTDLDDVEITQEEIDRERARMAASKADGFAEPIEPMATGISHKAFTEVVPPMDFSQPQAAVENKVSMNQSSPFKMVVIEPKSLEECRRLVDNLRARKPVIINLERVETDLARKMFDFLGGATYALSGNVQRVTQNIFIFAPNNVNINAKLDRANEASEEDSSSPWK